MWSDRDFLEVCPSPCRRGHIPTESGKRSAGSATSKERRRTRNDRRAGGMTHGKPRRPEWDCSRCGTCNLWQQAECRNPERIIAEVTAQTTEAVTSAEAARKAAELAGMAPELVNTLCVEQVEGRTGGRREGALTLTAQEMAEERDRLARRRTRTWPRPETTSTRPSGTQGVIRGGIRPRRSME